MQRGAERRASLLEASRVSDRRRDMDPEGLAAWVDTFCRQNPLKELYEAATGLYMALDHQP